MADGGLQRLVGLGVVVLHEGDGADGVSGHQRPIKDVGEVQAIRILARIEEVEVQGHVKERERLLRADVGAQRVEAVRPVFAHHKELVINGRTHLGKPALVKLAAHVLERVKAQAIQAGGLKVPLAPLDELPVDALVREVDVHAHEVVKVGVLGVVDVLRPVLAGKAPERGALLFLVPVASGEAAGIPDEIVKLASTPWEGKAGPRGDLRLLTHVDLAVARVNLDGLHGLKLIAAHLVVEDDVAQHLDALGLQRLDAREVVVALAVLGTYGVPLVKLAQVPEVVDAVANVVYARLALVCGWQPHGRETACR